MRSLSQFILLIYVVCFFGSSQAEDKVPPDHEKLLLSEIRQMTFAGARAGEGYFNSNGKELVFQSERLKTNPFFQIYLMNLETGDTEQISPGDGKTTCAWIHPNDNKVLYASTQFDPEAKKKQQQELDFRASGQQKRYSWDYDDQYDLVEFDRKTGNYKKLTDIKGYDAEGSYSPNGNYIAFASNRNAYIKPLNETEQKLFEQDPASQMEIFLMKSDGTEIKQLTSTLGYDGGPFFSPDGKKICWRRFSENGATAEIMTMNLDGSNQTAITKMGALSWAPFYHPSGEYLIFTTNIHGFANFELYMVDVQGKHDPVRVTTTEGFDGLASFSPDGETLTWTSNRTSNKQSQIFFAKWNHAKARELLNISQPQSTTDKFAQEAASGFRKSSRTDILPADLLNHVDFLCQPKLEGRMTGTEGEKIATEYIAALFDDYGLKPLGDNGTYFQQFDFTSGIKLGEKNNLTQTSPESKTLKLDQDWRPLSFSASGQFSEGNVVFAGYGIVAPKSENQEEYDSYVHLDVKDKWVIAFRYLPEEITAEKRQQLNRFAGPRYKAMVARDRGAKGLILIPGPTSQSKSPLIPLADDGSLSGSSLPVISMSDEAVTPWFTTNKKDLKDLQTKLDKGDLVMGFELSGVKLKLDLELIQVKKTGRNVIGILQLGPQPSEETILVGAHVDHLGKGPSSSSLAKEDEKNGIHVGADDNASGTAGMLEIAEYLSHLQRTGALKGKRDIIFAAWSGEEIGLLGSNYFVKHLMPEMENPHGQAVNPHQLPVDPHKKEAPEKNAPANPHAADPHAALHQAHSSGIYPAISACLNMDMIGRFNNKLVLQGTGSSSIWKTEIEQRNVVIGLPVTLQDDSYLPTDASSFFQQGVPILSAFTGSHSEYHTPRDIPSTLNYIDSARIAKLMALIAKSLSERKDPPDFIPQTAPEEGRRAFLRAYLGTIPDYAEGDIKGVKLSGVAKAGPADKAGIKGGDIIKQLAGKKIDNIYDYTYALEALKIGQTIKIVIERGGESKELDITPGSRE